MTNLVLLEAVAQRCREGFETLTNNDSSSMSGFPKGRCGNAAEIVGRILKEQAGLDGRYVCGNEHAAMKPSQSHAWYEVGDYIVDVTHDQFEGTGLIGWVFPRDHSWYAKFATRQETDGFCMPNKWPFYPHDGYKAVRRVLVEHPI